MPWDDRRLAVSRENSPHPQNTTQYTTPHTCACSRKRPGTRNKEQGGSQGQQRATPFRYWHCIYRFAVLTWYTQIQAGLTSWRINSAHGPERGSLHFNRCGCAGLGAARQCGNASGQEREVRPATTTHQLGIRPRGGNSSSTRDSRCKDSNCHLPPQTSTPTPTTPPPTVPTAGSHDPRSSHSANVSSSNNLKINAPTATTNNNSYDQPRPTTIPELAALVATGAINTASRADLLHPGHSGTCALHPSPPPLTHEHTQDCPLLYPSV